MPTNEIPSHELAEEFRRQPLGHHSPELQRVLVLFRGEPMEGKYVLVCTEPHRRWVLGQLPGVRGEPVKMYEDVVFETREEAEWEVFKRRWKKHFGEDLDMD